MIKFESVNFGYPDKTIFENLNLKICSGETWAIIGPSGCGKSTLLALIAGLIKPTSGKIIVDNTMLERPRPKTGLILQDYGLLPWATVRENANLGVELRKFYGADGIHAPEKTDSFADVDQMLDRLGLMDIAGKYPSQISGGQRQRTAIARTLVLNPDLFLLDEPFSSLDAPTRESLQDLMLELIYEKRLTEVLVTHSIEEAAVMGQKILVMKPGKNSNFDIFDNPLCGSQEFRNSSHFQGVCREIRLLLNNNINAEAG